MPIATGDLAAGLPVADGAAVRRQVRSIAVRRRGGVLAVIALHGAAAVAGLAAPTVLGRLVDQVRAGTEGSAVDRAAIVIAGFVVLQSALTALARYAAGRLGETVFAELRQEFVRRVLAVPIGIVERAGTGDLLTRMVRDVDALSRCVRFAVPEILVATVTIAVVFAALLVTGPLLALPCLVGVPILWAVGRWYLRRAPQGYLRENAAYSRLNATLAETAEAARTVEAFGLRRHRVARTDKALREAYRAERYTLSLRTVFFPVVTLAHLGPIPLALLTGGLLFASDVMSLGQVVTAVLYVRQLSDPVERLLGWLDELQVGAASLARILGVGELPDDRTRPEGSPDHQRLTADGVRFAYRAGADVLCGVDLDIRPGERLAVVGPSGAGKSTLGLLLAGIHPPSAGRIRLGGVALTSLPLPELRRQIAMVTQDNHLFSGTLRDNLTLARPDATTTEVRAALRAVGALDWMERLPGGLDTRMDEVPVAAARSQQVALARLVLSDPPVIVLDEATSSINPAAARQLESALAVAGRTVVAITHRLHTARDADRIAVVEDGRITELGGHDELLAAGGGYAALWRSWDPGQ